MKAQTSSIGHLIQSHLRRWKELTELSPQSTFCNCNLPLHPLFSSGDGLEAQISKGPWQKVVSRDADGCPDQKRRCQIGHPAPDILTGVARRHPPGYIFRFAGWAPAGPGPARAVLGCLCHRGVAPCSNSLISALPIEPHTLVVALCLRLAVSISRGQLALQ